MLANSRWFKAPIPSPPPPPPGRSNNPVSCGQCEIQTTGSAGSPVRCLPWFPPQPDHTRAAAHTRSARLSSPVPSRFPATPPIFPSNRSPGHRPPPTHPAVRSSRRGRNHRRSIMAIAVAGRVAAKTGSVGQFRFIRWRFGIVIVRYERFEREPKQGDPSKGHCNPQSGNLRDDSRIESAINH